MGININYRPLCNVDLWHGYYLHPAELEGNTLAVRRQKEITENLSLLRNYRVTDNLHIVPTRATQQLMAGYKMVYKTNSTGFALWIQAQKNGNENVRYSPFISFSEPLRLTFSLHVKRTSFLNFTNIPFGEIGQKVYYFSNQANNNTSPEDVLYLNRQSHYASTEDRVDIRPSRFAMNVSDLRTHAITFVLDSPTHRQEIVCREIEPDVTLESCQLHWNALPSGFYNFSALDEHGNRIVEFAPLYLNAGDIPGNVFGIIEILYLPEANLGQYALLQSHENQELQSPAYTLWWQNRLTRWRYLFETEQSIFPEADCDVINIPLDLGSGPNYKQLLTQERQPLISGYRRICFRQDDPNTGTDTDVINEEILLPNPDASNIYPDPDPEVDEIYSEVYLGNLNLNRM